MKIFFIAVIVTAILAAAVPIVIGTKTFDGIVTEKPYETGLLWDEMQREKAELRVDIKNTEFKTGNNEIIFSISDKDGKPLPDSSVRITVSRPATTAHDRGYEAFRQPDGAYHAAVNLALYGYWDLEINIVRDGKSVIFENRIFAEETIK